MRRARRIDPLAVVGLLIGVCVVGAVVLLGADERVRQAGEPGLLERWLIGQSAMPVQCGVDDNHARSPWRCQDFTVRGIPMAKTNITDQFVVSGEITMYSPADMPIGFNTPFGMPTRSVSIAVGTVGLAIFALTTDIVDEQLYYVYDVMVNGEGNFPALYVPADDNYHTYQYSIAFDGVVNATVHDDPIGQKAAVTHAKERYVVEEWYINDTNPTVTFNGYSEDAQIESPPTSINAGVWVNFAFNSLYAPDPHDIDLLYVTMSYNHANPDFGALVDVEMEPAIKYGSYYIWPGEYVYLNGNGNTLTFSVKDCLGTCDGASWGGYISPPIVHSFSGLHVKEMGTGTDLDTLEIWFNGVEQYDADTSSWQPVKHTLGDWKNLTVSPNHGIYSWDSDPPPDGAIRTNGNAYFWIDKESAQVHELEGFQESSVYYRSFDDDSCIVIDGWPLDATDRESEPYFDDVVTVAHRNNVGIYGPSPALTHESWVNGSGTTRPDVDGYFQVLSLTDPTLTLVLPSNYESRQAKVPSLEAPEGIPFAYITRKADWYVGEEYGVSGEDPEAVYCWLGWRYLRMLFDVPETCPDGAMVTVEITYKSFGTHEDNHYTDQSRQEEYVYTPGSQYTITQSKEVEAGNQIPVLIDLATDNPMVIVTSIKVTFPCTGEWRIGEPELVLDPGEDLPGTENDREAVTPHWSFKWFEHYKYSEGGMSAVVDGQQCGIEWPDHYKPNTVERWIGGNFDYREGKTSGIDFTAAWPLSTYVNLVNRCCDAWNLTYNNTADEAHLVDSDDNRLKTLSITDLVPTDASNAEDTSPNVAIRVGKWVCASGLHYNWYATKFVRGEAHGWAGVSSIRRNSVVNLYRRPEGSSSEWTLVEEVLSDGHGYWRSNGHEVVSEYNSDTPTYYLYTTNDAGTYSGRFAVREWQNLRGIVVQEITYGRYTLVALHPTRRILHFYATPEGIKHIYSNDETLYWRDSSIVWAGYTNPHTDTSDADDNNPSAMYTANGRTFLCWTNGTNVYMKYSDDLGETWSEASVVLSGYEHAFFWMDGHLASPIINAVAVDSSGNVVYTYSADGGSTFSNVVTVTTGAESAQPSGFTTINGRRCVVYRKNDAEVMSYSDDGGITWTELTP